MDSRITPTLFSSQKSWWESIVDTFNFLYEHSPITLASLTGYYHPSLPRLTGHPIYGRSHEIVRDKNGLANVFLELSKLATDKQNPRGMAYCSFLIIPSLLITRPTDIAQIFYFNDDKVFRGIPALNEIFGHDNLLSMASNPRWREKRNKLKKWIMDGDALTELAPEMQHIIDEFVDQLKEDGDVESLEDFLVSLTMSVFARTRLGSGPLGDDVEPISSALGHALDAATAPVNNILAKVVSTLEYYFRRPHTRLDVEQNKLKKILEDNFLKPQSEKIRKSEGLLKEYFDKHTDDESAFKAAYSDTALFLLAGQETTERLIQFTMLVLKKHPQIFNQLKKEIEQFRPKGNLWDRETLDKMHYLGKIIKEVLRLYPPVPIIPRIASSAVTLADIPLCYTQAEYDAAMAVRDVTKDIILPAGTAVNIMPWTTQRLEAIYKNPEEFDPDRHATDSINILQDDKSKHCAYIPFGAGSRDCPGRYFAVQEAKLVLISFIENFEFTTSLDEAPLKAYIRGTLKVDGKVSAAFRPRMDK